ncbi:DMT family transporter [Jiella endophytica]|uniref:DMT family transporter n=1 Tax=Jiella endophytica TaxID=2558362 RepID=A0A4Y8RTL8_9HYPH|nr:DMT family transporter [Jiella endophytica]TFF27649.1 DMT family transporter [Jiella endophytica]
MAETTHTYDNTPGETLKGMAIMIFAAAFIPLLDVFGKMLVTTHELSPGEVGMVRLFVQALVTLPIVFLVDGRDGLKTTRPGLNILRGLLLALGSISFFAALRFMPLADSTAVFLVEPLIVTLFSALFLKETIGWRRIAAVAVGFVGALIIIRPSYAVFGLASLLPLMAAVAVALYLILSRIVSRGTSSLAMMVHAGFVGGIALAAAMAVGHGQGIAELSFAWPHTATAWALLALAGVVGTAGHLLFILAYRLTPASILAPFGYVEIVSAIGFGYVFFGDLPDFAKWIGMAIIVGSGLFVFLRERQTKGASRVPPPH